MTANRNGRRRGLDLALAGGAAAALALGLGIAVETARLAATIPPSPAPDEIEVSKVVLDRAGRLLRPFATRRGRWRLPVVKAQVDKRFFDMLIGYEDRRFHSHDGVDYSALARAAGERRMELVPAKNLERLTGYRRGGVTAERKPLARAQGPEPAKRSPGASSPLPLPDRRADGRPLPAWPKNG